MNTQQDTVKPEQEPEQGLRASETLAKIEERVARGELTEAQAQELIVQECATADSAAA